MSAQMRGGSGLGGDEWFRRITGQLRDYREELRLHGVAMPPRPSSLPMLCALTRPRTIVDFGGSSGWCWDYLRETGGGGTVLSYVVVETPAVVDFMERANLHDGVMRFVTAEGKLCSADLLYVNSVLQYLGSNNALLNLLERTNPEFILGEDLMLTSGEDCFTNQSFRGSFIPYRFIGKQRLLSDLGALGYVPLLTCPYPSPINGVVAPILVTDFPQSFQIRYSSSVLLKRTAL